MPLSKANSDPAVASTAKPRWLTTPDKNVAARKFKKNQNPANTYGVNGSATANNFGKGYSPGWATIQRGTGPVKRVDTLVLTPGNFTVNTNVSVVFTSTSGGAGANGIANFVGGNLTSITVDQGGANYANTPTVTIVGGNGNVSASQLTAALGGRGGRVSFEILSTAAGGMAGVKDKANVDNLGIGL
jgi:hypothetical protein